MFERRLYRHIDWAMLVALLALCLIGLAMIYSATGGPTRVYTTQIYGILLGTVAFALCLSVDYFWFMPILMMRALIMVRPWRNMLPQA